MVVHEETQLRQPGGAQQTSVGLFWLVAAQSPRAGESVAQESALDVSQKILDRDAEALLEQGEPGLEVVGAVDRVGNALFSTQVNARET